MRIYSSLDAGAPQITNANGSLSAVLRACLVGTAGVAYGSKPSAGWSEPFATASNVSVFRQGAGGNDRYLRVVDNGVEAGGVYRRVLVRAYEAMTAIGTGTGPFPTTGQIGSNGPTFGYRNQSIPAGNSPQWLVFASSSFFHVMIDTNFPNGYWNMMAFGTFFSEKAGDIYNDVLMASENNVSGSWTGQQTAGMWVARSDTGVIGARAATMRPAVFAGQTYVGQGSDQFPYPDRIRNALVQSQPQLWVDGYFRGRVPGLWESHHLPADLGGPNTTWQGAVGSTLAGKGFRLFGPLEPMNAGLAYPVIETTDTWN